MHFETMVLFEKAKQQLRKGGYKQVYNGLNKEIWQKDDSRIELFYDGSF